MRKIYFTITILTLSSGIFAQTQDSLLMRQMELERDFTPSLFDADKINSLPALHEPAVQKANTNYSTWAGRTTPPLEIALPAPGNIMTAIPYNMKKGFIRFNAGNYANMDGVFGYRLVEDEKNDLSFTFHHNSTNGDINYLQDVNPAGSNAYFMDNRGWLGFRHIADALTFNMQLSYLNSTFNYYGNTFGDTRFYNNENQRLGILNAIIGIKSHESDILNYRGEIDFKNFSTRFAETVDTKGIKGTQLNAIAGFDKPFRGAGNKVGVDGKLFTTFYNGNLDDFTLVNAAPYITFAGINSSARLGADVLFQISGSTKIRVVPNVKLHWGVTDLSSLYATVHGGIRSNTFPGMISESRYIQPYDNVIPSFTLIDFNAGAKIGEVSGFRFDIFAGYKKTDDEHFLLLNGQDIVDGMATSPYKEVLKPVYGSLSNSHFGGIIQGNIWSPLDFSLRLKKNFYEVNDLTVNDVLINDARAYNMPGFEVDIRASLDLLSNLNLTLNYYLAGDRWSYFDGANLKMDNINDLNVGAVYDITDAFSVNARVNNLLSQKFDIWYGHPAQSINASGGFTFKF